MDKKKRFEKICNDIKQVRIQGARNIAKAALYAYSLFPDKKHKRILMNARQTEPMLFNVLDKFEKIGYKNILKHFNESQDRINQNVLKLIKNNDIIFTHCHSTNVVNALIYAKKNGRKFQVYNTETRPLYQGRKTAKELEKAGVKVKMFIDSAIAIAIEKENKKDKIYANKIFLGADALLDKGIINKIGSGIIAELAYGHKIPLYIIADSWKYTNKNIPIENRKLNEVWSRAPKHIIIKNPAFEFVEARHIRAIVSELGILSQGQFVKKAKIVL
ncbi:hypothetical protein J4433_01945 [Candidatus Pacearchaeota archaeon]|nr:hypothetical protein [Candidatus Pacearchaeota archaeon]